MTDVIIRLIDFPNTKCKEAVTENSDGSYTVFLNARQAPNIQKRAFIHAMNHIQRKDFEKTNVQEIEEHAH